MAKLLTLLAVLALAMPALAQSRGSQLESRVYDLEREVRELKWRLSDLERDRRDDDWNRPVPPTQPLTVYCLLTDSYGSRSFLGQGSTKLDAQYQARQACERVTSASNCSSPGLIRCDDTLTSRAPKHVCMVTDSYGGRAFRGEGPTAIVAEAKAKQSCERVTSASNCANPSAKVVCEAQWSR